MRTVHLIGVVILIALIAVPLTCARRDATGASSSTDVAEAPTATAAPALSQDAVVGAASPAQQAARDRETRAAVDSVHAYLRAVGAGDLDAAQARWATNRSPSAADEAGLRSLAGIRALRIQNRTPVPLDAEAVPQSLEIPVELRVQLASGQGLRFEGHYRVRRDPIADAWRINAAALQPVLR